MSYGLVQTATTLNGGTSQTATYASAQTAGNLNVAAVYLANTGTQAAITSIKDTKTNGVGGAYEVPSGGSGTVSGTDVAAIYYAFNIAAAAASANVVTMLSNADGTFGTFTIAEFSGVMSTADPTDGANSANQPSGGDTLPTVTVTTSVSNDLVVSTCAGDIGQSAVGTISGVTATAVHIANFTVSQYGTGTSMSVVVDANSTDDIWLITAAAFKAILRFSDIIPMIGGGRDGRNSVLFKM